jgi:hypothetical protein
VTAIAAVVRLDKLLAERADEEIVVDQDRPLLALYNGRQVEVVAVLERTAVIRPDAAHRYDRVTVKHDLLEVDPHLATWRQRPGNVWRNHARVGREQAVRGKAITVHMPDRVQQVDKAPITTCSCDPISSPANCARLAPLGLVPHPGGGRTAGTDRYVHCRRWLQEHEEAKLAQPEPEEDDDDAGLEEIAELESDQPAGPAEPIAHPGPRVAEVERVGPTSLPAARPKPVDSRQPDARSESQGPPAPSSARCTKCGLTGKLDDDGVCHRHGKPRQFTEEQRAASAERIRKVTAERHPAPVRRRPRQPTVRCKVCGQPTHRVDVGACKKCEPLLEESKAGLDPAPAADVAAHAPATPPSPTSDLAETEAAGASATTTIRTVVEVPDILGPLMATPEPAEQHLGLIARYIERVQDLERENVELRRQLAEEQGRRARLEATIEGIAERIRRQG